MAKPYSTIVTTAQLADAAGVAITSSATITVTVTFPDATTSTLTPVNAGGGVYTLKYTTKSIGNIREDWSVVGSDGSVVESRNIIPVTF